MPIRELANIILFTTAIANNSNNMASIQDIDMVVNPLDNLFDINNKFDKMRDCSLALSTHKSKSLLISLSECSEKYYVYVKKESNKIDEDEPVTSISSI